MPVSPRRRGGRDGPIIVRERDRRIDCLPQGRKPPLFAAAARSESLPVPPRRTGASRPDSDTIDLLGDLTLRTVSPGSSGRKVDLAVKPALKPLIRAGILAGAQVLCAA